MPVPAATLPAPRTPRYIYSDTVVKPRWQLIMHQLSQATRLPPLRTPARTGATRRTPPPPPHTAAPQHALACGTALRPLLARTEASGAVRPHRNQRVASRRIIVELHSEWGLPTSFFADVAQAHAHAHPHPNPHPNPNLKPNPNPNPNPSPSPNPNLNRHQVFHAEGYALNTSADGGSSCVALFAAQRAQISRLLPRLGLGCPNPNPNPNPNPDPDPDPSPNPNPNPKAEP